jgi:Uma2 family endonuclease
VTTTTQPPAVPMLFHSRVPYRFSVEKYEAMVASGVFTNDDRFELIEGLLVEKMTKLPPHAASSELCRKAIERLLPVGWHVRQEQPVRIPGRDSEPEPDLSVARGEIHDYDERHPSPADIALVVEVSKASLDDDRAMALTYGGGGIPIYWIVNLVGRQIEVYSNPAAGGGNPPGAGPQGGQAYSAPVIVSETESVDLVIAGAIAGRIPVADLLPRRPAP